MRALCLSFILHAAILFASYSEHDVFSHTERIHISLRAHQILPRVDMPSAKTTVKNSDAKQPHASGIVAAQAQALSSEEAETTMLRYTDMIRQRIQEALIYPHHARKDAIEGRTFVRFSINSGGELLSVELLRSSGYSILDEEALAAIRRASPFPKIPESLNKSHLTVALGLAFELK